MSRTRDKDEEEDEDEDEERGRVENSFMERLHVPYLNLSVIYHAKSVTHFTQNR